MVMVRGKAPHSVVIRRKSKINCVIISLYIYNMFE